jgi:hypothetical protein
VTGIGFSKVATNEPKDSRRKTLPGNRMRPPGSTMGRRGNPISSELGTPEGAA